MDFNGTSPGHRLDTFMTSFSRVMDKTPDNSAKKPFRQAVQEYDSLSKLFRQLMPFKDGIAELRRKKASYATIAELLNDEGIAVSARTVERFHRQFIAVEPRSRPKRGPLVPASAVDQLPSAKSAESGTVSLQERREAIGPWTRRRRGPRIADAKNL
jgi:hypothetical protein